MRRVLVTGATGFIGRHCVKALQKKDFVVHAMTTKPLPVSDDGVIWHKADLHDYSAIKTLLADIRPHSLLHLAWYVEPGQFWSSQKNLQWVASSLNLVHEFINNDGKRLVCSGTCAEYDWSTEKLGAGLSEVDSPINPATLYGASKASLQATISGLAANAGLGFAWGRLFFPYGPDENAKRLIPSTVQSLLLGKPTVCNHPELSRDFIFVEDVARIFAALIEGDARGTINIASGQAVKLGHVVKLIAEELHCQNLVECRNSGHGGTEPPLLYADISRLSDLGILPETKLEEGLKQTISWWQGNLAR